VFNRRLLVLQVLMFVGLNSYRKMSAVIDSDGVQDYCWDNSYNVVFSLSVILQGNTCVLVDIPLVLRSF